jgi:hypothetical protein
MGEEDRSSRNKAETKKGDEEVKLETDGARQWKEMRKKVEEEMSRKEIEAIVYWKGEMEKILQKKPESLGALQIDIKNFIQRMQNRIKVLKSSLQR